MTEANFQPPGTRFLRTDLRYMSRRDLFVSSGQFALVGALGLALSFSLGLVAFSNSRELPNLAVLAGLFALVILAGMGLVGCVYLFVRACRRDPAYDPREVWAGDQLGVDLAKEEEHRPEVNL